MPTDSPAPLVVPYEPLTLANAGGVDLAEQFDDAVQELVDAFQDDQRYRGKRLKGRITITLDLEYDPETRATHLEAALKVAKPKRKSSARALSLRGGRLMTETDDGRQVEIDWPRNTTTEIAAVGGRS